MTIELTTPGASDGTATGGTGATGDGGSAGDNTGGTAGGSADNTAGGTAGSNAGGTAGGTANADAGGTAGDNTGSKAGDNTNTNAGGTADGTDGAASPEDVKALPAWAQKRIRDLAKEAGDNRLKAKNAETVAEQKVKGSAEKLQGFIDGFAKVMGLTTDDGDGPPKNLDEAMKRLDQTQTQLSTTADAHRQLEVRLAVWETATEHGANTRELMDSASFLAKLSPLDPRADGFGTQLSELIKTQIDTNPTRFKAAPPKVAPAQSGGEFTGGPGGRASDADLSPEQHFAKINRLA